MQRSFMCLVGMTVILVVFSCGRVETSASLHEVVNKSQPTTEMTAPFPADSLLSYTYEQLAADFGRQSLARGAETILGTMERNVLVLYANTAKQIIMVMSDSTREATVTSVIIRKPSVWQARNGLRPGITLKEVERMNGKPFFFYGGGWDQGGLITNWNNGSMHYHSLQSCRLDRNHIMPYDMSKGDYDVHEFSSDSEDAKAGNPVVEEIVLSNE